MSVVNLFDKDSCNSHFGRIIIRKSNKSGYIVIERQSYSAFQDDDWRGDTCIVIPERFFDDFTNAVIAENILIQAKRKYLSEVKEIKNANTEVKDA